MELTNEQEKVLESNFKDLVVSASAGSGKTFVVIEKLIGLICDKKVPIERLLVLTFTKAASSEMKSRLYNAILEQPSSKFLLEQIDALPLSDISTIDSFCEKIIKRNINKLDLDENFVILEEKTAKNLKKLAFSRTFQYFSQNEIEQFEEIYFAFKRNKSAIEDCIFTIQEHLTSCQNQEEQLLNFEEKIQEYDDLAQAYLKNKILNNFMHADLMLNSLVFEKLSKNEENIVAKLRQFTAQDLSKNIFEICFELNSLLPLPALRGKIEPEIKRILTEARDYVKNSLKIAEYFKFTQIGINERVKEGKLIKAVICFYKHYINLYSMLKNKRDGLDFADIEYYARILLQDEEIKKGLQDKYDYIFIDEYQDTNRLQQSILKPIAEGGHFVAVGDLKQGIYGFRSARMEIMQEDIANFSHKEDGDALFLTGNFRTDKNILDFVNVVFEKIMTIDSVGIDYRKTSMLNGLRHYEDGTMPSVAVDIVVKAKNEEDEEESKGIYSVKNHVLEEDDRFYLEILAIQNRIEEALQSEIYDAKREKFRKVNYNDITLLFRGRSTLMKETYKVLSRKGFPINADIKETLLEDSEIGVIYSLLKLTLNQHDDISLVSALNSQFGGMSMDEIANLRLESDKNNEKRLPFYQIIENSLDEKVVKFKQELETFSFEIQVFGIIKALNRLFNRYDYYDYIYSLENSQEKMTNINALFKIIRGSDLDKNVPALINQLEGVQETLAGGYGNSITMTTIHATKGLEYPIVILCGAGESLSKNYTKSFIISEKFGFGSYLNDFDNMIRLPSPALIAGKIEKSDREFIDEIMIFYVAMTRAQNNLFIIGSGKEKDFSFSNLYLQNSYLKMIFYSLGENLTSQLFSQEHLVKGRWEFNVFDCIEEKNIENNQNQIFKEKFKEEIDEYNNFEYQFKDICRLPYKNSVTGATKLEEKHQIFANERLDVSSQIAIDRGNAYHEALKLLNFEKIENMEDLTREIQIVGENMTEGYLQLIDLEILLKNILIIKKFTKNCKLFKEKEFIMQAPLEELGYDCNNSQENVIVQGIVDLFAVGEEIVLIDYKFSSASKEILKERYSKQIDLYSKALAKATGRKIEKRYLLSLKNAEIIPL